MKNSHRYLATFILLFSILSAGPQAQAEAQGFVGGLLGMSVPDAEDSSARPMFGINGGAMLGTEYSLSGYYLTSSQEEDVDGTKIDFNYALYGVQGAYHFEGEAKGVWFGLKLGMSKLDVGVGALKVNTSPMHWGLAAGYDYWMTDMISIGGEASYISIAESDETINGVTVTTDAFGTINLLASVKLWF